MIEGPMIDDAVLEDLLARAADSVHVPPSGPHSIVAARDVLVAGAAPRTRRPSRASAGTHRGVWTAAVAVVAAAALAFVLMVLGHSGASNSASTSAGSKPQPTVAGPAAGAGEKTAHRAAFSANSANQPATPTAGSGAAGSGSGGSSSTAGSGSAGSGTGTSPDEVPGQPSKVIKTGSISLQVATGQLASTMTRLSDLGAADGGFVASSSTDVSSAGQTPSGAITVRVRVAQFENLLGQVGHLGDVLSETTSGQDVTSQYVDLQARISALQDARSQYEQILAKAETIGDILSVEQQISDLQTQIEQLQGRLQVMDDQTSYSTLAVSVTETPKKAAAVPPPARPPSGLSRAWSRARHSFANGIEGVIAASGGLAVFLIFATIIALAARIGWLRFRRHLL